MQDPSHNEQLYTPAGEGVPTPAADYNHVLLPGETTEYARHIELCRGHSAIGEGRDYKLDLRAFQPGGRHTPRTAVAIREPGAMPSTAP